MKVLLTLLALYSQSSSAQSYPRSDHYDGKHFLNPGLKEERSLWDVLKWKWQGEAKAWPKHVPNVAYPKPILAENNRALFTFINHASYLIQLKSLTVITDPVFSERVSPVRFAGPKRVRAPGLALDDLPPIQVVLISHNHYDHMDHESLRQLDAKFHPLFLVPMGEEKRLKEWGLQNVLEMDWWQEHKVKDVTITFTRSQHWSNRWVGDKFESLWGSYYIKTPEMSFYFAGDTGYSDHFQETKTRLGSPDIAILPIGAYEPRWFMKIHHMNPAEAVLAHQELGAKTSLPMHWGSFQLTDEGYDDPVIDLKAALKAANIPSEQFPVIDQGQSFAF